MAVATPAEILAEFTGTFLLIFTVGCNVLGGAGTWAGVSIACVLMVCIYAFGGISGANFNPAVSIGLGLSQQLGGPGMDWGKVGVYSAVQIAAGITAAFCYTGLFGKPFALGPAKGFGVAEACAAELLYTFMLVFVVMNVAASKDAKGKSFYGLAIGFVIIAGAYGAGAISGGCFNPAVALGIDVSSFGFKYFLPYVLAEIVGAAMAVGLFKVVRPGDFKEGDLSEGEKDTATYTSEMLGTFMLVLTVGLNVLGKSPAAAYSIAASLMCMIYALGDVSGAHFNPAVTTSIFIAGKLGLKGAPDMQPAEYAKRWGSQLLGGILAGLSYMLIYSKAFPLGPAPGFGLGAASMAEIVFTMVLCMVVLCVAVSEKTGGTPMFGLAIGSCVTVGGFAIGGVSGGSLNPAVSFGIATAAAAKIGPASLGMAAAYTVAELIGGGAAAGLVKVTHSEAEAESKDDKQTA